MVQHRGVDTMARLDTLARVAGLDDKGGLAVLAFVTEAEDLADLQVRAGGIDGWVHGRQLVAAGRLVSDPTGVKQPRETYVETFCAAEIASQ